MHSPKQSPKESSKEVQLLMEKVVHLESENRRLREDAAAEAKVLQNQNERLRSELTSCEEKLNLSLVRSPLSCCSYLSLFVALSKLHNLMIIWNISVVYLVIVPPF